MSSWRKEFDVNEIYEEDSAMIDNLHSIIDTSHFEMPANFPLSVWIPNFQRLETPYLPFKGNFSG